MTWDQARLCLVPARAGGNTLPSGRKEVRAVLKAIREFSETHTDAPATVRDARHAIRRATAALLVEVARLDRDSD